jgi:hypothetical protein
MKYARSIVFLAALAAVTGCGSIGEGSTVVSLEIHDPSGRAIDGNYPVNQCLRDQMIAVATFTDGTRADFSFRATWSSNDPALVQVSNNDIPQQFVDGGVFTTLAGANYRPGTLVPTQAATPGSTVTITARFLNMSSTKTVEIKQPIFRIAPLREGLDPRQPAPTAYLGPATSQRLGFYIEEPDGRIVLPTGGSVVGSLNAVLWRFQHAGNTFQGADPEVPGDFAKYLVPDATSPHASITPATGIVRGITADATEYAVQATTSLCEDVAQFTPTTNVRVAPFTTTDPLTLSHEVDINGPGTAGSPTGDLIAGTGEILRLVANLDTDGDLTTGEQTQDLGIADLDVVHTLACTAGDSNCVCEADGVTCTKRLLGSSGMFLFSLVNDDRAEAIVSACYTNVDASHTNDCDEELTDPGHFRLLSNSLPIQVIPVNLAAGDATFEIVPSGAAERAFTYPGQQFHAYGNFTTLSGEPLFAGGTSATAQQKITRNAIWSTSEPGTTVLPAVGFVRNVDDGYFGRPGSFNYVADVTENTPVEVKFRPTAPFAAIEPPDAVPFTVCPSTAGSCSP